MFLVANHPFVGPEGISRCREEIARLRASAELPPFARNKLPQLAQDFLETHFSSREPRELDGCSGYSLLTRKIDGSLPMLVGEVAVDLEIFADALNHLEVDVV